MILASLRVFKHRLNHCGHHIRDAAVTKRDHPDRVDGLSALPFTDRADACYAVAGAAFEAVALREP